ncbi:MAG: rod shape-determining protein RodA, partial [Lachnospiraceae bacterium]|nr:rod shape-determining protein RodA [Lachnospiraceae bacterium]
MFKNYRLRDFDFKLILMLIGLSVIGCLAIGSAEPSLQNKQIAGLAAGVFLMLVVAFFDYTWILKFYWLMY